MAALGNSSPRLRPIGELAITSTAAPCASMRSTRSQLRCRRRDSFQRRGRWRVPHDRAIHRCARMEPGALPLRLAVRGLGRGFPIIGRLTFPQSESLGLDAIERRSSWLPNSSIRCVTRARSTSRRFRFPLADVRANTACDSRR